MTPKAEQIDVRPVESTIALDYHEVFRGGELIGKLWRGANRRHLGDPVQAWSAERLRDGHILRGFQSRDLARNWIAQPREGPR